MAEIDGIAKMRRIVELINLAESEYVQELKRSNPLITEDEIKDEIQKWYLDKPDYWPEEFFRPASQERINRLLGKS